MCAKRQKCAAPVDSAVGAHWTLSEVIKSTQRGPGRCAAKPSLMQIAPTEMQWDGHPTPRAEDLAAYDALLAGASTLSFYAGRNVKDVAVMTYSVAVDGALGALTIRVNHDRAYPC